MPTFSLALTLPCRVPQTAEDLAGTYGKYMEEQDQVLAGEDKPVAETVGFILEVTVDWVGVWAGVKVGFPREEHACAHSGWLKKS